MPRFTQPMSDNLHTPACSPLPREILLQQRRCCGNGCVNCPYLPRHVEGSTEYVTMINCYVCDGDLMDMRGKMVCTRCMTINETCCDGGHCHPEQGHDKSSNYTERDDECF